MDVGAELFGRQMREHLTELNVIAFIDEDVADLSHEVEAELDLAPALHRPSSEHLVNDVSSFEGGCPYGHGKQ